MVFMTLKMLEITYTHKIRVVYISRAIRCGKWPLVTFRGSLVPATYRVTLETEITSFLAQNYA